MSSDRLTKLREFVEMNPSDCFTRYGVAQELVNRGEFDDAVGEFQKILEINADYQAAYYHLGKTFEKAGKPVEAKEIYEKGVAASQRTGDQHARGELEQALEELGGI